MYIPKDVIIFILGYISCPITAYLYLRYKEYREKKKVSKNGRN